MVGSPVPPVPPTPSNRPGLRGAFALLVLFGALCLLRAVAYPQRALTLSGDLVWVLALVALAPATLGMWARRLGLGALLFVALSEIQVLVGKLLMGAEPLLYDQAFLLRDFWVLLADLVTPAYLAIGVVSTVAGLGAAVVAGLAFVRAADGVRGGPRWLRIGLVAVAIGLVIAQPPRPGESQRGRVRWALPGLVINLQRSVAVAQALQRAVAASPYPALDGVVLARHPDVRFYIVESYGRLMFDDPLLGADWTQTVTEMGARLQATGWHAASGFSVAPVSGGRSWLADHSMWFGTRIRYAAELESLLSRVEQTPHLVRWFEQRGYLSVRVAPVDRARKGLTVNNDLGWTRNITHDTLQWPGAPVGWGQIPDQWTLGMLGELLADRGEQPLFLGYHMVGSHAPWDPPPPVVDDWRQLPEAFPSEAHQAELRGAERVWSRLARYRRNSRRLTTFGKLNAFKAQGYATSVAAQFALLERHLAGLPDNTLVVLMGDHQPPLVSGSSKGFDVPVHFLARDPALVAPLVDQGWQSGLVPAPGTPARIGHEGFYGTLVSSLHDCCGDGGPPPPDLRDGVVLTE